MHLRQTRFVCAEQNPVELNRRIKREKTTAKRHQRPADCGGRAKYYALVSPSRCAKHISHTPIPIPPLGNPEPGIPNSPHATSGSGEGEGSPCSWSRQTSAGTRTYYKHHERAGMVSPKGADSLRGRKFDCLSRRDPCMA